MTTQTFRLMHPGVVERPFRRPVRPAIRRPVGRRSSDPEGTPAEGAPVFRLVGVALVGWFGLMTVVTILAIY